ncbi:sigma-70 family RNA polymerase sigma factor [Sphingobacterium sp. DR205]|uniref:RNA polymerase sigma factor n=1 Tax=Sphingobacterium sp. DR205 TaxID=2713573 RepID=UPI0013E4A91B|nr:sigma-70 family RNA polymerase sigma factor [Sphingobacterium sp. DR205]QIH35960.1 sigma-70 family RNA polymerase sigma factor [Sphingobacterium sp. DR205]
MREKVEDEKKLIESFRLGDSWTLEYLFDLHYKSLCYFASRLIGDSSEAEDIVSDCFVKLWKSERQIKSIESIKAFLYISCRNACFDYLRKLKVRTVLQQEYLNQLEVSDDTVLVKIVKSEVFDLFDKEISLLPDKCQKVFRLFFFEQKNTQEVMRILDMNEKAVRYQKAKALDLLKSALIRKGIRDGLYVLALFCLIQES